MRVLRKGAVAVRLAARAFEFVFLRHRASIVLVTAHIALFSRLYEDATRAPEQPGHKHVARESIFPVEGLEPLTRSGVLAQAKTGSKCKRRGATLRRDTAQAANATDRADEEDALAILEGALSLGTPSSVSSSSLSPSVDTVEVYAALGSMHSARGHYDIAKRIMETALQKASDAGSGEAAALAYFKLAQLELNHHRYSEVDALLFRASSEDFAAITTSVAGLSCLGAWAALMQGSLERAEKLFLASLSELGYDLDTSEGGCYAYRDGLDACRSFALAGLSLVLSRRTTGPADGHRTPQQLSDCAGTLVLHAGPSDFGGPHMLQHARYALGLAELARGHAAVARRQSVIALRLQRATDQIAPRDPGTHGEVDLCGEPVSPVCSHGVLNLALAAYALGDEAFGKSYVDRMLGGSAHHSHAEQGEWLVHFARAHDWSPSGRRLAAFLMERAAPLMRNVSAIR